MANSKLVALSGEDFTDLEAQEEKELLKKEIAFWKLYINDQKKNKVYTKHTSFTFIQEAIDLLEYEFVTRYDREADFYFDEDFSGHELKDVWIYSESVVALKWMDLHEQDPLIAEGFYDAIFLGKSDKLDSFKYLSGYLAAHEFRHSVEASFSQRSQAEIDVLRSIHNDYLNHRTTLIKKARESISTFAEWQSKEETDWQARVQTLESTYQDKLRLEGPAKYWADKAIQHSNRGVIWVSILFAFLFLASIGLWVSFNFWLTGDRATFSLNHVGGILLFVTLLSTMAFSIRALSKLAFSSFHLQRDAEEREQLTHLYLALSNETLVDEDSRKIILQSLFSRSETGLISNETGPTMPGITDLLSTLKKPN